MVAQKIGVICRNCEEKIEVEDEYVPGIRGAELAAGLYQPLVGRVLDVVNAGWRKTLTCGNPACRQTREYKSGDLLLYSD
jgi:hypothetical protein